MSRKGDSSFTSIGVLTWHNHCNCGGNLQAYALKTVLNKLGYNVKFINYVGNKKNYFIIIKRMIRRILSYCLPHYTVWGFDLFQKKYLPETRAVKKTELSRLNKEFDTFICGSDQIWAPTLYDSAYFLDFVSVKKRKIAYAPSIGLNNIPDKLVSDYRLLLNKFNYIGVREENAKCLLENKCDIECCTVLDPTLLLGKEDYEVLEKKIIADEDYIFCYFLNQNNWYSNIIDRISKNYNCKLIVYSLDKRNANVADEWIDFIYPELFLSYIHNAKAIVTDSYHGTIFSIIYCKPFINLLRFSEDDPICQNSRIYDLLKKVGLEKRAISVDNQEDGLEIFNELDYNEVEQNISYYRRESLEFLINSLSDN